MWRVMLEYVDYNSSLVRSLFFTTDITVTAD